MPSIEHVGTKSHEVHHAPRNLRAALEIQNRANECTSLSEEIGKFGAGKLGKLFHYAFGFASDGVGGMRRNCPTGGNLGSPEALLWSTRSGRISVFRYLPLEGGFELIGSDLVTGSETSLGIVCLGNRERMDRKYGPFSESLIRLDGGVADGVFRMGAEVESARISGVVRSELEVYLDGLVREREYYYSFLWAYEIKLPASVREASPILIGRRNKLLGSLRSRRAVREFMPGGYPLRDFAKLVASAAPFRPGDRSGGLAELTVVLRHRNEEGDAFYSISEDGGLVELTQARHQTSLFLQRTLNEAPFALFFVADLAGALAGKDVSELDEVLKVAGAWVARIWLGLKSKGLGGCPCGAAVESDLQRALPREYRSVDLLFSFAAGVPRPSQ